MLRDVLEKRLASLTPKQEAAAAALVEEFRGDLAEVHRTALLHGQAGAEHAPRALAVLAQLAETAVDSLLAAITAEKPAPRTALLFYAVNGVVSAETLLTARLRAALADVRTAPERPGADVMEEALPPGRVCDEAYVALRRMLCPERWLQYLMESNHFLSLPEAERNAEIESWRSTGTFTRFLDDVTLGED